ncbi:hypothetical protein MHL86_24550, partial [Brevibacillus laterosporus]|nr:hypothetical protein [Brevibacillus laterosporus]
KRVYRLMKELNLRSIIRKKRRYFGKTVSVINPNLLNRKFNTDKPNHLYVTDITFVSFQSRFYYLLFFCSVVPQYLVRAVSHFDEKPSN